MTTCIVEVVTNDKGIWLQITPELSNGNDTAVIAITPAQSAKLAYLENPEYKG